MAVFGNFVVTDYTIEDGVWKVHFVNNTPGGGNPTDYYAEFALDEIPTNINQTQLAAMLKTRLAWTINNGHAGLALAVANAMTVTLP